MLKKRRDILIRILSRSKRIRFDPPRAGIYLWVEFDLDKPDQRIMEELFMMKEVGVVPGSFFGARGRGFIRFSFGYEFEDRIAVGGERIIDYLESQ